MRRPPYINVIMMSLPDRLIFQKRRISKDEFRMRAFHLEAGVLVILKLLHHYRRHTWWDTHCKIRTGKMFKRQKMTRIDKTKGYTY